MSQGDPFLAADMRVFATSEEPCVCCGHEGHPRYWLMGLPHHVKCFRRMSYTPHGRSLILDLRFGRIAMKGAT